MATIVITHGIPAEGFHALQAHRLIMPEPLQAFSMAELAELLSTADAVVAGGPLPGEVIRKAKNLKIIANYGAGYDRVDVAAAKECGIPVTNIPEAVVESTAELAFGLLLAVTRRIGELNMRLRQEVPSTLFGMGRNMGHNLAGKKLGIIGLGHIGSRVAAMAQAFGMKVEGINRHNCPDWRQGVTNLLRTSDVISLHCPLTEETKGLLNAEAFATMKAGSILINTSRGAVVDSEALADALNSGHLAGAGVDVYPEEPQIPACLLQAKNLVLTPHVGTNTVEARCLMA